MKSIVRREKIDEHRIGGAKGEGGERKVKTTLCGRQCEVRLIDSVDNLGTR